MRVSAMPDRKSVGTVRDGIRFFDSNWKHKTDVLMIHRGMFFLLSEHYNYPATRHVKCTSVCIPFLISQCLLICIPTAV